MKYEVEVDQIIEDVVMRLKYMVVGKRNRVVVVFFHIEIL